jgi:hypothetical protein
MTLLVARHLHSDDRHIIGAILNAEHTSAHVRERVLDVDFPNPRLQPQGNYSTGELDPLIALHVHDPAPVALVLERALREEVEERTQMLRRLPVR